MPLDTSIGRNLATYQAPAPIDVLGDYVRFAQIQHAQNQNALAQYQLGAAQREEAAQNALNAAYQRSYDPQTGTYDINKLRGAVISAGAGARLPDIEKKMGEMRAQQLTQQKTETELVDAKLKQSRQFLDNIDPADPNAPAQYLAWHAANHRDPVLGPLLASRGITFDTSRGLIEQAIQKGPQAFAQLLAQSKLGTEKFMELNKPTVSTRNLGATTETSLIYPVTGAVKKVAAETNTIAPADAARLRQEGERIGLERRRVAVLEENQRRDADPVFQQRMAGAKATGEAIAKGDVAAQQALPKIVSRAEEGLRLIDEMVGRQEVRDKNGKVIQAATKPHPGFEDAVGTTWLPGLRFVPGTDAADFMSRFDQIKGASFLEAFEALKGGGSITEKEGTKGTDAINRMSIAQSEKEFVSAARDLQAVIRKGVANAQFRATRSGGVTPAAPTIDALLDKYK